LHGVAGQPERAYWVYAAVNVAIGAVFAFLIAKRSTGAEGEPSAFRPPAPARSRALGELGDQRES
jgi:uncharacterized membrane protein